VFDVSGGHGAGFAAIVTGTVIAVLAIWSLFSDNDYGAWGARACRVNFAQARQAVESILSKFVSCHAG